MEAKLDPKDVEKQRNTTNRISQELIFSYSKTNVFAGAAVGCGASSRQKSVPKGEENARSRVRPARPDQKDNKKEKKRSGSNKLNPRKG